MSDTGLNGGLRLMDSGQSHANTFTLPQTITPTSGTALTLNPLTTAKGLFVNVPAYPNNTNPAVYLLGSTSSRSAAPHLQIDAFGQGNVLDVHWFPASPVGTTGGAALSIHGYRDPGAGQALAIIDNTDAGASVKIKNTQGTNNPNSWGRGNFLELFGYTGATAHGTSDGTITSGQAVLTSASGTFAKVDEGKPIRVPGAGVASANLDTTILTYTSATSVTLETTASTSVTTANYVYPVVGNVNQMLKVTGNPPGFGSISTTNTGALRFINTTDGVTNLSAGPVTFETSGGQCDAFRVYQPSGSFDGLVVNIAGTGAAFRTQLSGTNKFVIDKDGAVTRCGTITLTGATADGNLVLGTSTGTKIGTATSQKLGFYNATPIVQQTGVAVSAAGVHAAMVSLGLITA